ncbi:MAG: hypothetical protein ACRCY6_05060, partial [Bacteroidales bacterium]
NVVSSAGKSHQMGKDEMQQAIQQAGFTPWLRNQMYEEVQQ